MLMRGVRLPGGAGRTSEPESTRTGRLLAPGPMRIDLYSVPAAVIGYPQRARAAVAMMRRRGRYDAPQRRRGRLWAIVLPMIALLAGSPASGEQERVDGMGRTRGWVVATESGD